MMGYWVLVLYELAVFKFEFFLVVTLIGNILFTLAYLFVYQTKKIPFTIFIARKKAFVVLKQIYKFNLVAYAISVLMFLNYRLDLWVIQYFLPYKQLGAYALAAGLAQLLWIVSKSISSVLLPYLNNKEALEEEKQYYLKIFVRMAFSTSIILGLIGGVLGYFLIPFIYGEDFVLSKVPFIFLVGGVVLSNYYRVFSRYCVSIGKIHLNLYVIGAACVLTVVLDIILIQFYGIVGAAIATFLVYTFMFLTYNVLFFVKLKIPFDNYFILTKSDISFLLNRK
jgi:O-antigen/teichoic acid export membrane protein